MKRELQIFFVLLLFVSNLTFSLLLKIRYNEKPYEISDKSNELNLKKSGFWEVNQIYIDNSNPTMNWATTKATNEWCTGSGTINDPYIIEDVIINGQNSGTCIDIRYSSAFFIIRNCIVFNSGFGESGIDLYRVDNGKILFNDVSFNGDHGINLQRGDNFVISNNTLSNNRRAGISLESFHENCIISSNVAADNGQDGIVLRQDCDNNIITGNHIYSKYWIF